MLFIACKSNEIEDFCGEVVRAGFSVDTINAATVLDYNAIQFAYPTLDEDVLLINIGARSTNLLFKNPDGFFVRNLQLGGNSVTPNIADSLGKPFAKAEEIKSFAFHCTFIFETCLCSTKRHLHVTDLFIIIQHWVLLGKL